jgi:hypothetical protein
MADVSKRQRFVIGVLLLAIGLGISLVIFLQPQQLRVPAWVAYAAASTFPLSGLALVAGVLGASRLVIWLGILVVAGLLVPSLWVTLGPGLQKCSVSLGNIGAHASDWVCRAGFGIGSVLGLAVLVLFIRHAVSPKNSG